MLAATPSKWPGAKYPENEVEESAKILPTAANQEIMRSSSAVPDHGEQDQVPDSMPNCNCQEIIEAVKGFEPLDEIRFEITVAQISH